MLKLPHIAAFYSSENFLMETLDRYRALIGLNC